VDTTVVETDIHHPTDSSLLGDGVRVLTRTMKQITALVGAAGTRLRDRTRSVRYRLLEIGRASRSRAKQGQHKLEQAYRKLLDASGRVVAQAKRFCARDCQRRQACRLGGGTSRSAGQCAVSGDDDPAGQAGHAADA